MENQNKPDVGSHQKRENLYQLLLDTMSHGVQENDCDGIITYSNKAHHEILGYDYGELVGKKIWDFSPSLYEQKDIKKYFSSLVKEQPGPAPYFTKNLRKDGSQVDLQIDWDYERDAAGNIIGFISVITDITDRKNIEDNLRLRTKGLSTLLEVSKSLASSLDLQKVLQSSVDGVTKLTGLDTAAVYLLEDKNLHLWATTPSLPPQFPQELRIASLEDHPHIRKAIFSREPVYVPDMTTADLTSEESKVTEQRNLRTVLFVPLVVDAKAIGVFIVGSIEETSILAKADIDLSLTLANLAALTVRNAQLFTESKQYNIQLENTLAERIKVEEEKAELETQLQQAQKMEAIGRLAGGVAHDFNNMLSVILGYADLALDKVSSIHPLHSDLKEIRDAANRSTNLTRQLLAFARKQTATPKILNLNTVIGEMLKMLHRLLGEDIDLVWAPGDDLGLVKIDPAQIDQILANLCVNSRDAIPGTGKITIETSNATFGDSYCALHPGFLPGDYVMIAVSDDGEGIDQETLANIFEPFFSTKKEGKGTGLGLSTVYGIVKQNRGFINVYSEPGHGTTFKIYLSRHETVASVRKFEATEQSEQKGSGTILLVEDEAMILNLGKRMLESLGYLVIAANSPAEALILAKDHSGKIDLLITDVVMPDMNGRELSVQLETKIPSLKTLYISGYTANVIAHHGVLDEGVMLLSKPFTRNQLAVKVQEVMSMRVSE
jgi:PAS domain S-box-containing protein